MLTLPLDGKGNQTEKDRYICIKNTGCLKNLALSIAIKHVFTNYYTKNWELMDPGTVKHCWDVLKSINFEIKGTLQGVFMILRVTFSAGRDKSVADQGFPRGGANPGGGVPTYYLANFSGKLHENEEILDRGRASLAPPRSATANKYKTYRFLRLDAGRDAFTTVRHLLCIKPNRYCDHNLQFADRHNFYPMMTLIDYILS